MRGHKAYLEAVENAFGADIDYAQLQKIYGASLENETRYSPRPLYRLRHESCERESRFQAREHIVCGTPEPQHENEHSPIHSPDQCVLEEDREPRGCCGDLVHVLQFCARASGLARNPRDGKRNQQSCLDD
jgi:hypothetical protein